MKAIDQAYEEMGQCAQAQMPYDENKDTPRLNQVATLAYIAKRLEELHQYLIDNEHLTQGIAHRLNGPWAGGQGETSERVEPDTILDVLDDKVSRCFATASRTFEAAKVIHTRIG